MVCQLGDSNRGVVLSYSVSGVHLSYKHYICPLMPLPVHLLPLTGSAHHVELGFNMWKRTVSTHQRLPIRNPGPLVVEIGSRYDPQLDKRSSECSE